VSVKARRTTLADRLAWLRWHRSGLIDGFSTPEIATSALLGVQAQFVSPAGLALRARVPGFRDRDLVDRLYRRRSLVKLWGQRNTLHLYPATEWPLIHAAFRDIHASWRIRTLEASDTNERDLTAAATRVAGQLRDLGQVTRAELDEIGGSIVRFTESGYGFVFELVRTGLVCHGEPAGAEMRVVHRDVWTPDLVWEPPAPDDAKRACVRRHIALFGAVTVHDLAYWTGFGVAETRRLVRDLTDTTEVDVDGVPHLILGDDRALLDQPVPDRPTWSPRLLYRFDPLLLGIKDKSWIVPHDHYKAVWRKSGWVEAIVVDKGRFAGTWSYTRRRRGVAVTLETVQPVRARTRAALEAEAADVARYFDQPLARFTVA
jgi:hypothetical protein